MKIPLSKCSLSISVVPRLLWKTVLGELMDSTACTGGKAGWGFHGLSHLDSLEIWHPGCSLHVRKAPRAKLNTPPVSIRPGDIRNHLFLAVLGTKLKIFLIKKITRCQTMSPFLSNQALQACPHIRGELCHRITGDTPPARGRGHWVLSLTQLVFSSLWTILTESPHLSHNDTDTVLPNVRLNFSKPFNT